MDSVVAESDFVRAFVKPELRHRWLAMLNSPKGRYKHLRRLYHHLDFSAKEVRPLPRRASDDYASLPPLLISQGAGGHVLVISANREIDGRTFSFAEATSSYSGCAWLVGTVCIYAPNKLAVWTDEYENRYLLKNLAGS